MIAKIPLRKIYYYSKVLFVLILFGTAYSIIEYWRHDSKKIVDNVSDEHFYEMQIQADEAKIVPGLGEGGNPVELKGVELERGLTSIKKYAMNVYLSDKISLKRTLKDYRHPWCKPLVYDPVLPSVSVVVVFHNEPMSAILRTVWSVLNTLQRTLPWYKDSKGYPGQDPNSTYVFLKEIILVDDNSTLVELKGKLDYYIKSRLPTDIVRVVRLPQRVGLTQARANGAKHAIGDVVVFLDAHCEPDVDWLRPLLQRIHFRQTIVVTPIIDSVDNTTFQYHNAGARTIQIGGFTFTGNFIWIPVPEKEKARRGSEISPTWSPTMAGGLFAISRAYFWHLGGYDELMAGWGGENLELSFRIWQCGGTLESIPCSRVGHVFRSFHPYGMPPSSDTHGINTARMAEVWMDEYKELFYLSRPDLRESSRIGDVTHRRILREKLHCKSFTWFLHNIYPEKVVPVYSLGYGRFRNPLNNVCLDNMQRQHTGLLGVYPCHSVVSASQFFIFTHEGQLRDEERCAMAHRFHNGQHGVMMDLCADNVKEQRWRLLPSNQLQHVSSLLCLCSIPVRADSSLDIGDMEVSLTKCYDNEATQKWHIDYNKSNNYRIDDSLPLSEQEIAFEIIRKRYGAGNTTA